MKIYRSIVFTFFTFLLNGINLYTQDWSPFPFGQSNYYVIKDYFRDYNTKLDYINTDRIVEYLYDSVNVKSESERTFYSFTYDKTYKGKCVENPSIQQIIDPMKLSYIQYKSFTINNDTMIINEEFQRIGKYDFGVNSISINLPIGLNVGEKKEFDEYSVRKETQYYGTVFDNQADSIMKFSISFKKYYQKNIEFTLSKNFGLIRFDALETEPSQKDKYYRNKLELVGIKTKEGAEIGYCPKNLEKNFENTYFFHSGDIRFSFFAERTLESWPSLTNFTYIKDSVLIAERTYKSINLYIKRLFSKIKDNSFETIYYRDTLYIDEINQLFKIEDRNNNFILAKLPKGMFDYKYVWEPRDSCPQLILRKDRVNTMYKDFIPEFDPSFFVSKFAIDTIDCINTFPNYREVILSPELGYIFESFGGDFYQNMTYLLGFIVDGSVCGFVPDVFNSVVEIPKNNIQISPNPAENYIILGSNVYSHLQPFDIFDIFGKCVLNVGDIVELPLQIDVSILFPGVYFLKLSNQPPVKFIKL